MNTTLLKDSNLELAPSEVLDAEYVARRILEAAGSRRRSGALFKVYS